MRIGLLQFNPTLGQFSQNVAKAKSLLKGQGPFDLVVLPEMALSGYAFKSLDHIRPHLEPSGPNGPSYQFAKDLCQSLLSKMVLIGFPEVADDGKHYNSAMFVKSSGLAYSYRKKHLYETDETWATEGDEFGHFVGKLSDEGDKELNIGAGICMDLNNHQFRAPWDAYEFGNHCIQKNVDLIIVPMAWTKAESTVVGESEDELSPIRYWLARLGPVLDANKRTLFVACNRTGSEGKVQYQGNSCVVSIDHGELSILGKLNYEEGVLVVDVDLP